MFSLTLSLSYITVVDTMEKTKKKKKPVEVKLIQFHINFMKLF